MTGEKTRGSERWEWEWEWEPAQNFIHEYVKLRLKTTALPNLDDIANHEH